VSLKIYLPSEKHLGENTFSVSPVCPGHRLSPLACRSLRKHGSSEAKTHQGLWARPLILFIYFYAFPSSIQSWQQPAAGLLLTLVSGRGIRQWMSRQVSPLLASGCVPAWRPVKPALWQNWIPSPEAAPHLPPGFAQGADTANPHTFQRWHGDWCIGCFPALKLVII